MSKRFLMTKVTLDIDDDYYQIRHYLEVNSNVSYQYEFFQNVYNDNVYDGECCLDEEDDDDEEEEDDDEYEIITLEEIESSKVKRILEKVVNKMKITDYTSAEKDIICKLVKSNWFKENENYFKDKIYEEPDYEDSIFSDIEEIYEIKEIDFDNLKEIFNLKSLVNVSEKQLDDIMLKNVIKEAENIIPTKWITYRGNGICISPPGINDVYYIESIDDFINGLENNIITLCENNSDMEELDVLMFKLEEGEVDIIHSDLNGNGNTILMFVDIADQDSIVERLKIYKAFSDETGCELKYITRNCDNYEILKITLPY